MEATNAASSMGMVVNSRAVGSPMKSAVQAVNAVPILPSPKDNPIIMPEAMPALPGIKLCAQTMELGCGASRKNPEKNKAIRAGRFVPACVKK